MDGQGITVRRIVAASLVMLAGCGRGDALAQERTSRELREQIGDIPAVVDTGTAASLSGTFRAAAARALPSVVTINVTARPSRGRQSPFPFPFGAPDQGQGVPQTGTGSGFVFSSAGHIITNNHVVADATEIDVRFPDGRVYSGAEVVGRDPNTDIAVVKIEPRRGEEFAPLEIGDSDRLQVGDWVLALGNPLDLGFTVTAGIVSAKGRSLGIIDSDLRLEAFIQTDAAINRGNSGGPLVDLFGRLVGVNTAIYSPTGNYAGNGFAVPSAIAVRAARDLIEHGYVRRPRIGVLIQDVGEAQAELYGLDRIAGAYVTEVSPGGPAQEAGIRPEDVVVAVDGEAIESSTELTTRLARLEPGDRVTLEIVRDRRRIQVPIRLAEFDRPEQPRRVAAALATPEQTLGFTVSPLTPQLRGQLGLEPGTDGLVVTRVNPNGSGGRVLQEGDVILEFNRQPVRSVRDLERAVSDVDPGDIVVLRIRSVVTGNVGVRSFRVR
ncbi:MAG TPA: trypsin-like peptidase domain-containing protein [Longimicrobiales bacterium]|nr:trypsin-like peptidase domain-containing protein [Longimicrobiales bacterium]